MAGRKKKSAGRMPLWLYVLIVVAIALVTYFCTSGEAEGGDPQPPAASAAAQQTPADETLTVRFLDVGQGDSILLACGDETMLIDGGPVEEGQFLVSRLNRLDVTGLTYVVNTHPDEDHCGGLAAVLATYPAEHVYSSVTEYTTKVFSNVVKYADEQGHPVEVPQTGDSWTLGSASVQIIGPVQTYSDPNNGSLVLRVDYGGTSFLFTGDMEQKAEADLMDSGANVRADVLRPDTMAARPAPPRPFWRLWRPPSPSSASGRITTTVIRARTCWPGWRRWARRSIAPIPRARSSSPPTARR